eukprot:m.5762 g.5762  ORF g.5762 m.5762 type:complete len:139 (-) comp2464_c0_seq1:217-633(-)
MAYTSHLPPPKPHTSPFHPFHEKHTVKAASAAYKDALLLCEECKEKVGRHRSSSPSQLSQTSGHSVTDATYLGLVLNYAVFIKEIIGNTEEAITMCEHAFDDALNEIDQLNNAERDTVTSIMHIIQNNLTLWKDEVMG